ncbi:amidohydrolase family protein [Sporichthya polymorpha]|uniref:amidohydrolase family protein n=1 Tax=Sporichthya polymorpha TaxID=35751 RepID=UPI00037589C6|nr:amidohydrolase family protein [Sporichthya polymorpha]
MPLRDDMQLISVDDHLVEPPHLWQDRLPVAHRDAGPRIIQVEDDAGQISDVWLYEGRKYPQIGLNAVAGKPPEQFGTEPMRYTDMIPGCYEPEARVIDMDLDGVQAAICFPSFPRFAGTVFLQGEDKALALLCVQAWNDFMLDEWCAAAPERFIPIAILPLWDVDAAVKEIHRVAARGAKAISFTENPVPLGLPSFHTDHWDPVFSAAEETGLPLCLHFGTSGQAPTTAPDAPFAVTITLFGCNSMFAAADLIFSPVFHHHPNLKVALAEGGIGWVPYLLERADYVWDRHRWYQNVNQAVPPSELFRRHIWGCFIDDVHGLKNRHEIGIDRITWECDYPHSDSNWPNSRKRAIEVFADIPDDEVARMVEWNSRELFNFPRTPTDAA